MTQLQLRGHPLELLDLRARPPVAARVWSRPGHRKVEFTLPLADAGIPVVVHFQSE